MFSLILPTVGVITRVTNPDLSSNGDELSFGGKDKDHAKLYFGKFHHPVLDHAYGNFPVTCPPNSQSDFRSNDYQFRSSQWLVDGIIIPGKWPQLLIPVLVSTTRRDSNS